MDWTKVDKDHMPPEGTAVFITVLKGGKPETQENVVWNAALQKWQFSEEYWSGQNCPGTVTHWMPYPAPATD